MVLESFIKKMILFMLDTFKMVKLREWEHIFFLMVHTIKEIFMKTKLNPMMENIILKHFAIKEDSKIMYFMGKEKRIVKIIILRENFLME